MAAKHPPRSSRSSAGSAFLQGVAERWVEELGYRDLVTFQSTDETGAAVSAAMTIFGWTAPSIGLNLPSCRSCT